MSEPEDGETRLVRDELWWVVETWDASTGTWQHLRTAVAEASERIDALTAALRKAEQFLPWPGVPVCMTPELEAGLAIHQVLNPEQGEP